MSTEVDRFIAPPRREECAPTDFPTIAFRAVVQPNDLAAAHADTAPCEIVPFDCDES